MWVDIHSHSIDPDPDVTSIVSVRYGCESTPDYPLCSLGLHPWDIERVGEFSVEAFRNCFNHHNIRAVGEAGLDRSIDIDFSFQKTIFEQHINIAEELHLPLIIHCVKSYPDVISLIKGRDICRRTIFHGFRGNAQQVLQILKHECAISFGAAILQDIPTLTEAFRAVPLDRLFLETDTSDDSIKDIYSCAAELLSIPEPQLINQINANFSTLFST